MELSIRKNFEAQRKNAEAYRAGKCTEEMLRLVDRIPIESLLPQKTPAGAVIGGEEKTRFLDSCRSSDFPSIAIEAAFQRIGDLLFAEVEDPGNRKKRAADANNRVELTSGKRK